MISWLIRILIFSEDKPRSLSPLIRLIGSRWQVTLLFRSLTNVCKNEFAPVSMSINEIKLIYHFQFFWYWFPDHLRKSEILRRITCALRAPWITISNKIDRRVDVLLLSFNAGNFSFLFVDLQYVRIPSCVPWDESDRKLLDSGLSLFWNDILGSAWCQRIRKLTEYISRLVTTQKRGSSEGTLDS